MKKVAVFSVVLGMAVLMAAGCATTAKGPSDEEQTASGSRRASPA